MTATTPFARALGRAYVSSMLRPAVVLSCAVALSACAFTPNHTYSSTDQRYKEGSVLHAYGATMTVGGLLTAASGAGSAAIVGDADTGRSGSDERYIVPLAIAGIGVAIAAIGLLLIDAGNDKYTPKDLTTTTATVVTVVPRAYKPRPGRRR